MACQELSEFSIHSHFGIITAGNHRHLHLNYLSLIPHRALPRVWLLKQHLKISWQVLIAISPPLPSVEVVLLILPKVLALALSFLLPNVAHLYLITPDGYLIDCSQLD